MKWGHGYWETVALQRREFRGLDGEISPYTAILQKCRHCGKIKRVTLANDWTDYADGIYDDGGLPEKGS